MEAENQLEGPKEISPEEKARLARKLRLIQRVYFGQTRENSTPTVLEEAKLRKISATANRILRDDDGKAIIIFDQSEEGFKTHYLKGKQYIQSGRLRLKAKLPVVIEESSEEYNWINLRKQNGLPVLYIHSKNSTFAVESKSDTQSGIFGLFIVIFDPKKGANKHFETLFDFSQ